MYVGTAKFRSFGQEIYTKSATLAIVGNMVEQGIHIDQANPDKLFCLTCYRPLCGCGGTLVETLPSWLDGD